MSRSRPPYGYRLVAVSAHPNAEKARVGATLNRLEPDPETAPIVRRIFAERLTCRHRLKTDPLSPVEN